MMIKNYQQVKSKNPKFKSNQSKKMRKIKVYNKRQQS